MASAQDSRTASNGALPDLSGLAGRTPADRAAAGRAARAAVPRRSHARFHPSAARPDPVALLAQQDAGRIADLLPIRFGRMLASPFAFLRGAALIMASDLSGTPVTGLYVQACHFPSGVGSAAGLRTCQSGRWSWKMIRRRVSRSGAVQAVIGRPRFHRAG